MDKQYLCSICQRPAARMICRSCRVKWGAESRWVKDLMVQEHHWRMVNRHEAWLSPVHISVEGDCYRDDRRLSQSYLLDHNDHTDDIHGVEELEDLERLTHLAGLTPRERLTYRLMLAGFCDDEGAQMINDLERKNITASAYRGRLEKVIRKIHDVIETD